MAHGNLDLDAYAIAGWSKSAKLLAFLQQTCDIVQSSMDVDWCYGPCWLWWWIFTYFNVH